MSKVNKLILVMAGMIVVVNCEPPGRSGGGSQGYGVPSGGGGGGGNSYGAPQGNSGGYGNSGGHKEETYPPRPYNFAYAVNDHYSGANFGQMERSDGNNVNGEYRVLLPDGRTQIVTYTADWKNGFNADVRYQGEAKYPEPPAGGYGGNSGGNSGGYGGSQGGGGYSG